MAATVLTPYHERMECTEKTELQRACTSAWESCQAHAQEAGIPTGVAGSALDLAAFHKTSVPIAVFKRETNAAELSAGLKRWVELRGEHMKASRALSRHLALHRC